MVLAPPFLPVVVWVAANAVGATRLVTKIFSHIEFFFPATARKQNRCCRAVCKEASKGSAVFAIGNVIKQRQSSAPNTFRVASFAEGNEKAIRRLFSLSYSRREMPPNYWEWRFKDNPSGRGIIELAWDESVLAAHYAVTSVTMSIGGKMCLSGFSGTTMTAPAYRGLGLFPVLASRAYQEARNRGMTIVWGFPNVLSHRGFVRDLGWRDIYEIPCLRLRLTPGSISSAGPINRVQELHHADSRFDHLWETTRNDYDIIVCRDSSYINWRYFSNPTEKYRLLAYMKNTEIEGYAVVKRHQDELQVIDLFIGNRAVSTGKTLIDSAIAEAIDVNAKSVGLWLNPTHCLRHTLEQMGFKPEGPVTYLAGLALNSHADRSIYDFRRWHFTMSDSDVF